MSVAAGRDFGGGSTIVKILGNALISLFRNGPIRYAEMAPPRIAGHPAESAGGLDGAENEGGAIRTDTSGIRVRHRDGKGRSAQARGASADGAPGAKGCATASTQASTAAAAGDRECGPIH